MEAAGCRQRGETPPAYLTRRSVFVRVPDAVTIVADGLLHLRLALLGPALGLQALIVGQSPTFYLASPSSSSAMWDCLIKGVTDRV